MANQKDSYIMLLIFILIILLIFFITLMVNVIFGPFLKKDLPLSDVPMVSILVPARNEQENISNCLTSLRNQNYPDFEILVLDDDSQDRTARIVSDHAAEDKRIRLLRGKPLENGWTGKNWACHQLAQEAAGEVLIFTDADTQHADFAVRNTVARMQNYRLDMLSAFPQQITRTLAEKLIVPVIDFFVYAMLPLWSTYLIKSPLFAAANGQWIAFRRQCYGDINGHVSVKSQVVEDVVLNRRVKAKGFRTLTTAGTGAVFCRMYHSPKEVWYGFSKNFFGLTGHNSLLFLLITALLFGCCVLPYFLPLFYPVDMLIGALILINILLRFFLAIRFKHPPLISVLLHPVAIVYALLIGFNSYYQYFFGRFYWKDRYITIDKKRKVQS